MSAGQFTYYEIESQPEVWDLTDKKGIKEKEELEEKNTSFKKMIHSL